MNDYTIKMLLMHTDNLTRQSRGSFMFVAGLKMFGSKINPSYRRQLELNQKKINESNKLQFKDKLD